MIYNRTQTDIDIAIAIRKRIQSGETLTEADINALERGTLTINTLNRIEQKQAELKGLFNSIGYWDTDDIVNREWNKEDYFKQENFNQILTNLEILQNAYYIYANTPNVPNANYRQFGTVNAVEHILADLEKMIEDMEEHYRYCGEVECGGD
jgi:hypothetical protein